MSEEQEHIEESIIVSYLSGDELPDATLQDVEKWLESEKNQEEAKKVYRLWELSLMASPETHDAEAAYQKLSDRLFPKRYTSERSKTVSFGYSKWLVAASIAMVMGFLGWWLFSETETPTPLLAETEKRDFILEDQSKVSLKNGSELTYFKSKFDVNTFENREVWLKGEGYFEVEHHPKKSFVVHTKDADVTVLGTKFLVKEQSDLPTKVLVLEGEVKVQYKQSGQHLILKAKEEVVVDDTEDTPQVVSSDDNQLYWKTGIMTFDKKSLGYVFETLSQEFGVPIVPENEAVFSCKLTGTFKKQSLETIMKVIETTHGLESHFSQDTIIIKGDGCQ